MCACCLCECVCECVCAERASLSPLAARLLASSGFWCGEDAHRGAPPLCLLKGEMENAGMGLPGAVTHGPSACSWA